MAEISNLREASMMVNPNETEQKSVKHTMTKMNRRGLRIVLEAVAALVFGFVLLAGAGIYVLSTGPVSIAPLTPILQQALNDGSGPYEVTVENTKIVWGGWDRAVDVIADNVRVQEAGKPPLAVLPEISVGLSFKALLAGEVRLTTLEILRPFLTLLRDPDGSIAIAVGDLPGADEGDDRSDRTWMPVPRQKESNLIPSDILDALTSNVSETSLLGGLQRFSVLQAEIRIVDRALGETLWLHGAGLDVVRSESGLNASLNGSLETPTENALVGATVRVLHASERIDMAVEFDTLDTNLPIRYVPDLVFYLPDLTVSGTLGASFDFDGAIRRVTANLKSAAGSVDIAASIGEDLPEADISAEFDAFDTAVWLGGLYDAETAVNYLPRVPITGTARVSVGPTGIPRSVTADLVSTVGSITIDAEAATEDDMPDGLVGALEFSSVKPKTIAQTAPALGMLDGVDIAFDGNARFNLSADWRLQSARVTTTFGAGRIQIPNVASLPPLTRGRAAIRTDGPTDPVILEELFLDFDDPTVSISGVLTPTDSGADISLNALALDLQMNQLSEFWPAGLAPNPREWVLENIPEGDVQQAGIALSGSLPDFDPNALQVASLNGSIRMKDGEVHYLRPLTPVIGVDAFATFTGSRFDIDIDTGEVEDARLNGGRIEITALDTDSEQIDIALNIETPLPTALTLLDTDPFQYISKIGLEKGQIDGRATTQVRFKFPLLSDLTGDDVIYEADATLYDLSMYRAELDATITADTANLTLVPGRLDLNGHIAIDGIPAAAVWRENFGDVGERLRYLSVTTISDIARFEQFDLPVGDYAKGRVGLGINFAEYRNGGSSLALTANLSEAELSVPELNWRKEKGQPSDLFLQAVFRPNGTARVENFLLDGMDDHRVEGAVELAVGLKEIVAARFERIHLGLTDISATVNKVEDRYNIELTGTRLDVAPFLADDEDAEDKEPATEPKLRIVGRFDQLSDGPDRNVRDADLAIHLDGDTLQRLELTGLIGDGRKIDIGYLPTPTGGKNLSVLAEDTGMALATADVTGRLEGGTLKIQGHSEGPEAPMKGRLEIQNFRVLEAPRLAKLLEVISVTGILSALSDNGIDFNTLSADFSITDDNIDIEEGAARGDSIGITFQGSFDRINDALDINGDVAVSGIFSQTLGQLPIIDILVGDGLIGAAYKMTGPVNDPSVSVNPLSVIAPGFLRKVFEGGGTIPDKDGGGTQKQHGN